MKIVLDRKDIEEAITDHIIKKYRSIYNNEKMIVVQGKAATATVTITKEDNDKEKQDE